MWRPASSRWMVSRTLREEFANVRGKLRGSGRWCPVAGGSGPPDDLCGQSEQRSTEHRSGWMSRRPGGSVVDEPGSDHSAVGVDRPQNRDPLLSLSREATLAAVTTGASVRSAGDPKVASAVALKAALGESSGGFGGAEKALLVEWLDRPSLV